MGFEYFDHTADVKFRASGKTYEEMFKEAANALNHVIRGDISILKKERKNFVVDGPDLEVLLYNYLEEFLFLLDAEDFLTAEVSKIEFDLKNLKLKLEVIGDIADNYKFTNDVKAITFNEMYVRNDENKFECQVVLDV